MGRIGLYGNLLFHTIPRAKQTSFLFSRFVYGLYLCVVFFHFGSLTDTPTQTNVPWSSHHPQHIEGLEWPSGESPGEQPSGQLKDARGLQR